MKWEDLSCQYLILKISLKINYKQSNSYFKAEVQGTQGNKMSVNLNWVTQIQRISMKVRPPITKAKPSHQKCPYTKLYLFQPYIGDTFCYPANSWHWEETFKIFIPSFYPVVSAEHFSLPGPWHSPLWKPQKYCKLTNKISKSSLDLFN